MENNFDIYSWAHIRGLILMLPHSSQKYMCPLRLLPDKLEEAENAAAPKAVN